MCEQRNAALVRMTLGEKRKRGRAPREFGDGAGAVRQVAVDGSRSGPRVLASIIVDVWLRVHHVSLHVFVGCSSHAAASCGDIDQ